MINYMKKSLGALLFTFLFFIPVTSQAGWYELDSGTTNTLWAIHGADENSIIAVGEDGLALYTTDGGDVWEEGVSGTTEFLNDVYMISSEVAVAVGDNHTIIKTEDGGATWSSIAYGSLTTDWYTVAMYSADDFIVAGSGSDILITDDGVLAGRCVIRGTLCVFILRKCTQHPTFI